MPRLPTAFDFRAATIKRLVFGCISGFCSADQRRKRLNPGDVLIMFAANADVTVTFRGASPFVSGTNPIRIRKGGIHTEIVARPSSLPKTFLYRLSCQNPSCPALQDPPEMIVE